MNGSLQDLLFRMLVALRGTHMGKRALIGPASGLWAIIMEVALLIHFYRGTMGNHIVKRTKLPPEDLAFLMANTNFTRRQIKQWYRGFIRDCPSGQLSQKKFVEVYSNFFPGEKAEEFSAHVFRTFDKDKSSTIDFREFLLAINITSRGKPEEKLEWAFQMYDIDGNGSIEWNEMVQIIKAIYSMLGAEDADKEMSPETRTTDIFSKIDENKDGILNKDEFIKGCLNDKQLFSMLMADGSLE